MKTFPSIQYHSFRIFLPKTKLEQSICDILSILLVDIDKLTKSMNKDKHWSNLSNFKYWMSGFYDEFKFRSKNGYEYFVNREPYIRRRFVYIHQHIIGKDLELNDRIHRNLMCLKECFDKDEFKKECSAFTYPWKDESDDERMQILFEQNLINELDPIKEQPTM